MYNQHILCSTRYRVTHYGHRGHEYHDFVSLLYTNCLDSVSGLLVLDRICQTVYRITN